jgi:hypothetical protein
VFGFEIEKSHRVFSCFFYVFLDFFRKAFFIALTVMLAADIAPWTVLKDDAKLKYLRRDGKKSKKNAEKNQKRPNQRESGKPKTDLFKNRPSVSVSRRALVVGISSKNSGPNGRGRDMAEPR